MISTTELAELATREGFTLPCEALEPLAAYLELLMRWNKAMNLVGAKTWQEAVQRLIADSVYLAGFLQTLPLPPQPLCWDLGAGAGLPGIPLRMLWNAGDYWMIEAREKRALFLSTVLSRTPLERTHVFRGRLEAFFANHPAGKEADLIVSRAFMPWEQLLPLVEAHVRPRGFVVLLLNEAPKREQFPKITSGKYWKIDNSFTYKTYSVQRTFFAMTIASTQ